MSLGTFLNFDPSSFLVKVFLQVKDLRSDLSQPVLSFYLNIYYNLNSFNIHQLLLYTVHA